eukprot:773742-Prymnesium_polylepis.1
MCSSTRAAAATPRPRSRWTRHEHVWHGHSLQATRSLAAACGGTVLRAALGARAVTGAMRSWRAAMGSGDDGFRRGSGREFGGTMMNASARMRRSGGGEPAGVAARRAHGGRGTARRG